MLVVYYVLFVFVPSVVELGLHPGVVIVALASEDGQPEQRKPAAMRPGGFAPGPRQGAAGMALVPEA